MEDFTFPKEIIGKTYSSGFTRRIPKSVALVSNNTLYYRIELHERSFQMECNLETKEVTVTRDYIHDTIDTGGEIKTVPRGRSSLRLSFFVLLAYVASSRVWSCRMYRLPVTAFRTLNCLDHESGNVPLLFDRYPLHRLK